MNNLLTEIGKKISVGEAAIYAVIGFLVVFVGIAILVLAVWLIGLIFKRINENKKSETETINLQTKAEIGDESQEELIAVITAAIAAVYTSENRKPEFTVKKIKRI